MDYFYTKELAAGYGKEPVVKGANLHLQKGEIVTLIAPNGAGKTTLLKSIIRQLEPLGGVAVLEGRNLAGISWKRAASQAVGGAVGADPARADDLPGKSSAPGAIPIRVCWGCCPGRISRRWNALWSR